MKNKRGLELVTGCSSGYSRVSNRREGQNKPGGWQILAKIINWEGALHEEVGENPQS